MRARFEELGGIRALETEWMFEGAAWAALMSSRKGHMTDTDAAQFPSALPQDIKTNVRTARADERSFVGHDDHRRWIAYETAQQIGRTPARPYLIFESEKIMRRVRTFPTNWRELDDVSLERLSWRR